MSKQEIASLSCKILGLYMLIQSASVLANSLIAELVSSSLGLSLGTAIFPFIVLMIFGILLWVGSDRISVVMVGENSLPREEKSSPITPDDIQRVAFSVLGLFFIGRSLPQLPSVFTSFLRLHQIALNPQLLSTLAQPIIQFLVGLGIFFGSSGLVNLLSSLRKAGVKEKDDTEDEDQDDPEDENQ